MIFTFLTLAKLHAILIAHHADNFPLGRFLQILHGTRRRFAQNVPDFQPTLRLHDHGVLRRRRPGSASNSPRNRITPCRTI